MNVEELTPAESREIGRRLERGKCGWDVRIGGERICMMRGALCIMVKRCPVHDDDQRGGEPQEEDK